EARAAPVAPLCFLALPVATTARQQWRNAQRWVERYVLPTGDSGQKPLWKERPHRGSPLKIGYLSSDFHAHPTAWLTAELFEKHDRSRFTVCGYSFGPDDGSPTRQRIAAAFDRFVDLQQASLIDAARQIAADEVDILVDLKGHTKSART